MAKKRIGDKAERVLKLLLGLRDKKIASALASRGFGKDDLREGLALLAGVTDVSLAVLPPTSPNPAVIEQLDRWENEWFPVANATLLRRHPEIHARVFLNLSQTDGPAVFVSVSTFVKRIGELTRAEGGYGQEGKDARKLLQRRGLTTKVIDEAKALLEQIASIEEAPVEPVDIEEERARLQQAEDAMWAWYLEWSEIARSAIKDRNLLRKLGFLASSRGTGAVTSEEDEDDEDDEDAAERTPLAVVTSPA